MMRLIKSGYQLAVVNRIRQNVSAWYWSFTWHSYPPFLRVCIHFILISSRFISSPSVFFVPYLERACIRLFYAGRIQRAANDVVTYTRKVFNTAAANQHNAVLLQVVSDPRNIGRYFNTVVKRTRAYLRRAEFGFFGVIVPTRVQTPRFCGEFRSSLSLQRVISFLQRRRFRLVDFCLAAFANELVNCWHYRTSFLYDFQCFAVSPQIQAIH